MLHAQAEVLADASDCCTQRFDKEKELARSKADVQCLEEEVKQLTTQLDEAEHRVGPSSPVGELPAVTRGVGTSCSGTESYSGERTREEPHGGRCVAITTD